MRARRRICTLLIALAGAATSARADVERLVLLGADRELERAALTALSPWGVEVVSPPDAAPGAGMPEAADRAAAIAAARAAGAVVWVAGRSATLLVYDARERRVMALRLPSGPPFDPLTAAAVALTIKTLLRYSGLAPLEERFAPPPPPGERLLIEVRGGARARPAPARALEPRVGVALVVKPVRRGRLALTFGFETGPGFAIERDDFVGHLGAHVTTVGARLDLAVGRRLALSPGLAVGLHAINLAGAAVSLDKRASAWHLDPAADATLDLRFALAPRLLLTVLVRATYLARRQRYLVGGAEVFDVAPLEGGLAAGLAVTLF